jgi:hypothetical protein
MPVDLVPALAGGDTIANYGDDLDVMTERRLLTERDRDSNPPGTRRGASI